MNFGSLEENYIDCIQTLFGVDIDRNNDYEDLIIRFGGKFSIKMAKLYGKYAIDRYDSVILKKGRPLLRDAIKKYYGIDNLEKELKEKIALLEERIKNLEN